MKLFLLLSGVVAILVVVAAVVLWTPDKSRAELEAHYLASPADMIAVAGATLHVRDTGPHAGPAVILLHGLGSELQTWDGWAGALEDRFRVVRMDLPGCGLSSPDPTGDYSDTRSMALIEALMDRLGIAKASLVGNSIGGRIAWRFAASRPERVAKLVLVSPDGYASPGFEYGRAPDVPLTMRALRYVLPKSMLRGNIAIAYADPSKLSQQTLDRYYDLMLAPGARTALLQRMEQTILPEPDPILKTIRAPVLLLWGEDDRMIPIANAAQYQRTLPHATLVRLPRLGHVPQEENPQDSIKPVRAFLEAP